MHSFAYQLWFVSGRTSRLSISWAHSWRLQSCSAVQLGHALWSWMPRLLLVFTRELKQGVREAFGHWAVALGTKIAESHTQYRSSWKGPAPPRAALVSAARQVLGTWLGAEQAAPIHPLGVAGGWESPHPLFCSATCPFPGLISPLASCVAASNIYGVEEISFNTRLAAYTFPLLPLMLLPAAQGSSKVFL